MRRAVPVLAATAGGIALLANFHSTPATATHVGAGAPASTSTDVTPEISVPTMTAPDPPATAPGSTTSPTTTRKTTTSTAPATSPRTITGPDVTNRYGDVQVRITVTGHHIDDVQALRLPSDRQRSAEISGYAGPELRQEALQAQSANIDIVSGATYTSESYIRSLQGAIDAEH